MRAIFACALALLLPACLAATVLAQDPQSEQFSDQRLEEIAAPIALYPDSILMQIFMASTYPLEVIEADRWLKKQPLSGDALDKALKDQDWDPSVKSLCTLPTVLSQMSENLDWTRDMGDAFLENQSQLLDAVQRLRGKAHDAGSLTTSPQQTVTVQQDQIIVIESADPDVVYIPTYSPTVVYGTWPYTTVYYAPLYVPPPPGHTALAFTAGVVVGAALWGNCHWGWGHSNVNINVNHYNNFNRHTNNNYRNVSNNKWQHNAEHRKGVNYRDRDTARKYGAGAGAGRDRVSRGDARGYDRARGGRDTAQRRDGGGQGSRANRSGASRNSGASTGPNQSRRRSSQSYGRGSGGAYQGSRNPHADRAASKRGSSSRSRSSHSSRSSGGRRSGGGGRSGGRSGGRRR